MSEGVKAIRNCCAALASKLRRPRFSRRYKLEHVEFLASGDADWLIEEYVTEHQAKVLGREPGTVGDFGDGQILQKWLDFLGSEGFQNFMDAVIPFIVQIFEIISALIL